MKNKPWLGVIIILAVCSIAMIFPMVMVLDFFAVNETTRDGSSNLPVYSPAQAASTRVGYRHCTLTCGTNSYVHDSAEACLQLAFPEPTNFIGRIGSIGNAKAGAVPGQSGDTYIAGDVGSEMPAYIPYRRLDQPPFDWRAASFRAMSAHLPGGRDPLTTTNTALIVEVIRTLRDGKPVELPRFTFGGVTNLTTLRLTCDQLPGLLFCPLVYADAKDQLYLTESLMINDAVQPPQLHARWISAGPLLMQWLTSP